MATKKINRRQAVKDMSLGLGAMSVIGSVIPEYIKDNLNEVSDPLVSPLKGNVNHAACRWCYQNIPLPEFAEKGKEIGLKAIDLLKPDEWKIVQDAGLVCSLATDSFASITHGFNNAKNHEKLTSQYLKLISQASEAGIEKVIVFSGNRNGISEELGMENCAKGLDVLVKHAEKNNVTLLMELLNSKVDP